MRHHRFLGLLAFLPLAVLSCQKASEETKEASQLSHNLDDPIRSAASWNWLTVTRNQFITHILQMGGRPITPVSDAYQELETRTRYWVNKLDTKIRSEFPQLLAHVPKPEVIIISENSPNAFISAAFPCFEVSVRFPRTGRAAPQGVFLSLQGSGSFSAWPKDFKCIPTSTQVLTKALAAFNERKQSCQLQLVGQTLKASGECTFEKDLDGFASAEKVVIPVTANWMTVHSGLFPAMPTEKAFVGVIAHELGHYYRSHITSFAEDYDFFYNLGEANPNIRPEKDPSLTSFGEETVKASQLLGQALEPVSENQSIAPEIYLLAGSIAEFNCSDGQCPSSCQQVTNWEKSSLYLDSTGFYPFSKVNNPGVYTRFEQSVAQCLALTKAGSSAQSEITFAKLTQLLADPIWMPFGKYLDAPSRHMILQFLGTLATRLPSSLPDNRSAWDWVQAVGMQFALQKEDATETLTKAADTRLGQYTTEQEADESALEWLTEIGISADAGVEMFLALAGNSEDRLGGLIMGGKQCKELQANDWLNAMGVPVFVPVGDYNEVHHSSCFRAYNADREILSHGYPVIADEPVVSGPSWAQLQRLGRSAGPATAIPARNPASLVKLANHHWKDCPFAVAKAHH